MKKKKVRVIVQMYGGCIQSVDCEDPSLELDVVFTEGDKYGDEGDRFQVKRGTLKGDIVYTHHESSSPDDENGMTKADFVSVFAAARRRIKNGRAEG